MPYTAEDIVNWRTACVGNDPDRLVQVVLREDTTVPTEDGFGHRVVTQYRELALIGGEYRCRVWTGAGPALVTNVTATPWAAGVVGAAQNAPLKIGPSVCWQLEKDGKAGTLEFTGAGLAAIRDAMAAREKQMAVLGGRLLLDTPNERAHAEAATTARLRYDAEAASLRTIAGAVSAAFTRVLRGHVWWDTVGDLPLDVRVELGFVLAWPKSST